MKTVPHISEHRHNHLLIFSSLESDDLLMMAMTPEQEALICRVFDTYLSEHHHDDILLLLDDDGDETHHPVVVNAMTLFEANMEVRATPTTSQKS